MSVPAGIAQACRPFRRLLHPCPATDPTAAPAAASWDAFSVRTDLIVLAIVVVVALSYLAAGRV